MGDWSSNFNIFVNKYQTKGAVMIIDERRMKILESLANELMKPRPSEEIVKKYMKNSGLNYEKDPIQRISMVLKALNFHENSSEGYLSEKRNQ